MAKQTINIGTRANDASGDTIRDAFDKVNDNFNELYLELGNPTSDIKFSGSTISTDDTNQDLTLDPNGTGAVIINGIKIQGTSISSDDSTQININEAVNVDGNVTADAFYGDGSNLTGITGSSALTFVGDDSTGTTVNSGETFKIAGAGTVTTAVSGDTITITGAAGSVSPITFVGDDSTGTAVDLGETFKIAGATGITTAVSGDTLTITGPNLSSYLTDITLEVVGDDSSTISFNNNGRIQFSGSRGVTTATDSSGTVTITGPDLSSYITASSSDTLTNKTIDANGTGNSITNLEVADFAAASIVTEGEGIGSNDNDTTIPTSAAVKDYVDNNAGGSTGDLTITGSTISAPSNADLTLNAGGTGSVDIEGIQIKGTEISSSDSTQVTIKENLHVTGNITGTLTASGNDTEVQFNNSGAFAGDSGLTFDSSGGKTLKVGAGGGTVKANSFQGADSVSTGVTFQSDNGSGVKANHLQIQSHTGSVQTVFPSGAVDFTSAGSVDFTGTTVTGLALTMVGDDSSGTAVNTGETFKFAGATGVTTAVSGDTLTITGPDLSSYLTNSTTTIVGDDSSGTTINSGETFKFAGATGITTAVSGDTLTITGPDLSSYITASSSDTLTNKTFDVEGTGNSISNIDVADFKAAAIVIESEGIGSNDNDTTLPTSAAVKDYVDTEVSGVSGASTGDITFTGSTIQSPSNADITLDPSGTGGVVAQGPVTFNAGYIEKINALTSSSTITVDCALASIHTVTLGTSTEFNITNLPTGGSVTLIITQDGTGTRTATFGTDVSSAVKFPSNSSTLSTGGGDIDVVTIINDGTNFLGNIAKDYRSS